MTASNSTPPTRKMLDFSTFDWRRPLPHRSCHRHRVLYVWAALTAKLYLWKHKVPPTTVRPASAAHSLSLCVGSLWMCAGAIGEIRSRIAEGLAWFFCESQDPPPRLSLGLAYYQMPRPERSSRWSSRAGRRTI